MYILKKKVKLKKTNQHSETKVLQLHLDLSLLLLVKGEAKSWVMCCAADYSLPCGSFNMDPKALIM